MITELITADSGRYDEGRFERIERQHDVRSVRVALAEGPDGTTYPRLAIKSPGRSSHPALREKGPVALEIFDDENHDARGSAVVGADETWLRTVVDRDLDRTITALADYRVLGRDVSTRGDVIRLALRSFLESHVDLRDLPEDRRPEGIEELPDFEAIAVNGEESAEGSA